MDESIRSTRRCVKKTLKKGGIMSNAIKELTITKEIDAPIEKVWKAWTDPKIIQQWWGPDGVTNPICEFDATPGGKLHIEMLAGEELGELKGSRWPMKGVVTEIEKPTKLIFTSTAFEDEDGKTNLENLVTVTFSQNGDKTKMIIHIEVTKATEKTKMALKGMDMGWNQQINKLEKMLAQK